MTTKDIDQTQNLAVIILAAGKGTRMKSELPKVMHKIAGLPILSWIINRAEKLNPEKIIIVAAPDMNNVAQAAHPHHVVIQEEQKGTGDAVKPALELLKDFKGKILVLLGDEPFLDINLLQDMVDHDGASVMAIRPESPKGLGRMMLGSKNSLKKIIEERDCSSEEKEIHICNAGNFCFKADQLHSWISQIGNKNAQGEYYLTDLAEIAQKEKQPLKVFIADTSIVWGINTRSELAAHEEFAQGFLRERAMEEGVTLISPETTTLSWDTELGPDVVIEPNVYIAEGVSIEEGAVIHAFSYLEGCDISINASVGPYARIRSGSHIGEEASVGNFIEINRSIIESGAKAKHVSYLGDCTVGEGSNIGAGTIVANYDGFFKHKTKIGKKVFVGSNSTIISPVKVGDKAIIAAGSNVNKDIPGNAMAIGRSKQENHLGWASEYRALKRQQKVEEEED
ncbi:MAG: bifunctional UDP-N-acetylglucosamine diphosphorylase/glucosamine-1-phosphate N-acetyltransferase GlmU [Pseudomonadota bacterium]